MSEAAKIETYDPKTANLLSFHDAVPAFVGGSDTPRAYLERAIDTIEAREPDLKAFVTLNFEVARAAADASSSRYKDVNNCNKFASKHYPNKKMTTICYCRK